MININIKPLSINKAYRGRRFKTAEYKSYCKEVFYLLPNMDVAKEGKLYVKLIFGFSSKGSDIDNAVKNFTDILQDTYRFNDNRIYKMDLEKVDVKKGEEFIRFEIKEL